MGIRLSIARRCGGNAEFQLGLISGVHGLEIRQHGIELVQSADRDGRQGGIRLTHKKVFANGFVRILIKRSPVILYQPCEFGRGIKLNEQQSALQFFNGLKMGSVRAGCKALLEWNERRRRVDIGIHLVCRYAQRIG